ncbi:hypothetical protein RHSP_34318 [Rhizobium freirei PRF 81]|uniref:Uncharacterized protein n=1 Tax=Rhizobium freirei PRF 81 TaxID=363754 RepID=N6UX26_9HYPH|nr:hypothetical protein RHSP_34318 [Rhizobium freirei PRF 81]
MRRSKRSNDYFLLPLCNNWTAEHAYTAFIVERWVAKLMAAAFIAHAIVLSDPVYKGPLFGRATTSKSARRAAVAADHRSRHIACRFAAQKGGRRCEFLDAPIAAGRNALLTLGADIFQAFAAALGRGRVEVCQPVGGDAAGQKHVHGDPMRRHLAGQCLAPADESRAQRIGECQIGDRLDDAGGGDGEDASPALSLHARQQRVGQADDPGDHGEEVGFQPVGGDVFRRSGCRAAAVVDENVDAAELLGHGPADCLDEVLVAEIRPDPVGPAFAFGIDGLAIAVKPFSAAAAEKDVYALSRQRNGDAMPQALGRGEHQCTFPINLKIHVHHPSFYSELSTHTYRAPQTAFESSTGVDVANAIKILTLT